MLLQNEKDTTGIIRVVSSVRNCNMSAGYSCCNKRANFGLSRSRRAVALW